jgi:hypothetical protein
LPNVTAGPVRAGEGKLDPPEGGQYRGCGRGHIRERRHMLTSCAAGLVVVNIDSGFGAAMAAFRLSRMTKRMATRIQPEGVLTATSDGSNGDVTWSDDRRA